jgi:hypothetical protein
MTRRSIRHDVLFRWNPKDHYLDVENSRDEEDRL